MIEEVIGDLLAQDVDCIVNAANEQLQLGGGVAGAIRKADRSGEVQRECNEIVAKQGAIPTGQAALTTRGDVGPVIHAVGPVYNPSDPDRSAELLRQAYVSTLTLAKRQGYRTIAFPYISTGIYGFPRDRGVEIAHEVAAEYDNDFDLIRFVTLG